MPELSDHQYFIDALREMLGLQPLYHEPARSPMWQAWPRERDAADVVTLKNAEGESFMGRDTLARFDSPGSMLPDHQRPEGFFGSNRKRHNEQHR